MPDGNDGDSKFCAWPGITAFDAVQRILRRECGENAIGVVEGTLQIFDQLSFGFRRIVAAPFAVVRRLLALKFVEEGKLGAGDVLHLFAEAAGIFELPRRRDVGVFVLRHDFGNGKKIPFRELECAAYAFRDGLRNVIWLGCSVLWRCGSGGSNKSDATGYKKHGSTKRSHLNP